MNHTPVGKLRKGDRVMLTGEAWGNFLTQETLNQPHEITDADGFLAYLVAEGNVFSVTNEHWSVTLASETPTQVKNYFHEEPANYPDNVTWHDDIERISQETFDRGVSWVKRNTRAWPYDKQLAADVDRENKCLKFYWIDK